MTQNYGESKYWDDRYMREKGDPFDWLLAYNDISAVLDELVSRQDKILMVGCGNAPFSPDMYNSGFTNIVNIDISTVVINQQKEKYPEMKWIVMDVHHLEFESGSVDVVLDKSLIDTVLCYSNSLEWTNKMVKEIYRVLRPGGRYISISLHTETDIADYFVSPQFDWRAQFFYVPNPRWDEKNNSRRSVAHTLVVCDKYTRNSPHLEPLYLKNVLREDELQELRELSLKVNSKKAIILASLDQLVSCLHNALLQSLGESSQRQQS